MVKSEVSSTTAKLAGGAATYAGSYTAVEKTVDVAQAGEVAALVAGIMTVIYFAVQIIYTLWKWRQEARERAIKENRKIGRRRNDKIKS